MRPQSAVAVQLEAADAAPARPAEELLHELRLYQIELQMQNESLRQAQQALEASRDSYADLFEFAPLGYLIIDAVGQIKAINRAGRRQMRCWKASTT